MFHGGHDWRAEIDSFLTEKVYVTVDVDVFDPRSCRRRGRRSPTA
jgi:arginase family enzyme